jgi:hypothetical protein
MDHPMRYVEDAAFFGIDFGGFGRVRLDTSVVLRDGSPGNSDGDRVCATVLAPSVLIAAEAQPCRHRDGADHCIIIVPMTLIAASMAQETSTIGSN